MFPRYNMLSDVFVIFKSRSKVSSLMIADIMLCTNYSWALLRQSSVFIWLSGKLYRYMLNTIIILWKNIIKNIWVQGRVLTTSLKTCVHEQLSINTDEKRISLLKIKCFPSTTSMQQIKSTTTQYCVNSYILTSREHNSYEFVKP